eukprot:CAMPEP_0116828950 /NCGR_PEP_ID=MMETSP0418-20121206/3926_1 /TAXON_ID=1158023 /ORGANISM="Astrosyne radiata, Strain 13vi08-1A" /LENGTH=339 /DNA_ID=CAMNT_0004457867 /DNA_START=935 /DNA_END=1954 /DNA_ORIENTATION=+
MIARKNIAAMGRRVFILQSILSCSKPVPSRSYFTARSVPFRLRAFRPYPSAWAALATFATSANTESSSSSSLADGDDWHPILPYQDGSHKSAKILVRDDDPLFSKDAFGTRLDATISACRTLGKQSVWVDVPMSKGSLLEDCHKAGLRFHHAEGEVASLCLWLNDMTPSKIPTFATHRMGVGAMVVNAHQEILCVREMGKNYLPWKVPGGLAELGEDIADAVVREVLEETGIACSFVSILAFRHTHQLQFGRSDLFFMCRLEVDAADDEIIPEPSPQPGEIDKAAWIPLEEFKNMVRDGRHPMMEHLLRVFEDGKDIHKTIVNSIVPGRKPAPIYYTKL